MANILEVNNLFKQYGELAAVDRVSFAIPQGICFGLLGPNGAGKTTTIEMIENVISADGGEVLYKGRSRSGSFKEEVGIQFQETLLLNFLTVGETLAVFQNLYQKSYTLDEIIRLCSLERIQNQYNDKISGGQKQRLLLALALINKPDLLFLDEPSTGLDPQARRELWQVVEAIKHQGKTIILTTHYMEEAQHLCDEIAIMDHGRIIARGSPQDLIAEHCRGATIRLPKTLAEPLADCLADTRCTVTGSTNDHLEIDVPDANACLKDLLARGIDLSRISLRAPNLEDVFLNLTGRQLRE
ncbi:MAG: ABC transporter ATP-binding protein [Desulfobacterales bacterium]